MRRRRRSRLRCRRRRRGRPCGDRASATTLPRTLRRRSASRGRAGGEENGAVQRASPHRQLPEARERRPAPSGRRSPRSHARSGSPGTCTTRSTSGGRSLGDQRRRLRASRRRPFSFHERTNVRARSSYTIAERARAKARRRPEHSAQRRTGQAPGEPQRSQTGGLRRTSASRQGSQSAEPGRAHTAQRSGKSSSSTRALSAARCYGSAKRCGRLPQESRRSRCRTTAPADATCRPTSAGRAIRRGAPAGRVVLLVQVLPDQRQRPPGVEVERHPGERRPCVLRLLLEEDDASFVVDVDLVVLAHPTQVADVVYRQTGASTSRP